MQRKNAESGSRPNRRAPMGSPHGPCHDSLEPASKLPSAPANPRAQKIAPKLPPAASAARSRRQSKSGTTTAAQSPAMAASTSCISAPARHRAEMGEHVGERRALLQERSGLLVVQRVRELREHAQVILDGGAQEEKQRPHGLAVDGIEVH